MFAITGITGRVGGRAAEVLLDNGAKVRAVLRDRSKAEPFAARGAEVALADVSDVDALTRAFTGVEGAFIMIPPNFAPERDFPETRANVANLVRALDAARTPKVVLLSSVGAQRDHGLGLITQSRIGEEALARLDANVALLRPGWFMENHAGDVVSARETGRFESHLSPLDRPFPLVSTEDIGRVAAETLLSDWTGHRVVEVEGPRRYSMDDLARAISDALGQPVAAVGVPRDDWTASFEAQGMPPGRTDDRAEMVDGFNSGWIDFEGEPLRGRVTLEEAVRRMAGWGMAA